MPLTPEEEEELELETEAAKARAAAEAEAFGGEVSSRQPVPAPSPFEVPGVGTAPIETEEQAIDAQRKLDRVAQEKARRDSMTIGSIASNESTRSSFT